MEYFGTGFMVACFIMAGTFLLRAALADTNKYLERIAKALEKRNYSE